MSPFSFIQKLKSHDTLTPMFNFSPLFDVMSGYYTKGTDDVYYLNGGLTPNNAITGGNNTQKTGVCVLAMVRMLIYWPSSVVIFFDVESTFDVTRLAKMVDREINIPGYFNDHVLDKRFFYYSRSKGMDGTFIHNFVKDYGTKVQEAIKSKEDVYLTLPFPDNDGNPIKVLNPTTLIVDSISEMDFIKVSEHFQDGDVDAGGEKRTRDMNLGNMRRIVYEDVDVIGGKSGFVQLWTAQVVDIINMTGQPLEKQSVFIRQGKKLKAPKALLQRPPLGIEIFRGGPLKNGQEWMYPNPFGKDVVVTSDAKESPDLIQYSSGTYRCKSGPSGFILSFIGSQSLGIQEELSMYDTLKKNDYYGLDGNKVTHNCTFYPECKFGRTTVWNKTMEDKRLCTALTLQYHLLVQNTTNLELDKKYRISPKEVYDKIIEQGYDFNEFLDTVYFYHGNPDIKKPTLTIMELLCIAVDKKKPYWHNKK